MIVAVVCLSRWWHRLIGNYIAEKKRDRCFSLFATMVGQVDWQLYS